jgi:hypothetical protein
MVMKCFVGILIFICFQDIPFKAKDEFEVKLNYDFKQRPVAEFNTVRFGESAKEQQQRASSSVLPYLILNITPLALSQEKMRVRIATNLQDKTSTKKVSVHSAITLDLGFTDDMKDRVTPHEYSLTFITSDKSPVDKIVIRIEEDGSFYVNDEKRGKF